MTTIRSTLSTTHPAAWHALATDLGLTAEAVGDGWTAFRADGLLTVQAVEVGSPDAGRVTIEVLVEEPGTLRTALEEAGHPVLPVGLDAAGPAFTVAVGGAPLTLVGAEDAAATDAAAAVLSVMPIRYTDDVAGGAEVLRHVGLRSRIAADGGGWADFVAPQGGLAALHHGADGRTELSFEYRGDLDALADRLRQAGHEVDVVDEAYNRTALVTTPDGWRLWVNGAQEDLYGYARQE